MEKRVKIYKSFEEQERYYLEYFYLKTPLERLRALTDLQKKTIRIF